MPDPINGTDQNDTLKGNAAGVSDTIYGGRGNDYLNGYSGDDVLSGGRGDDRMIGGSGSDVMSGGLDSDTFEFSAGHITEGTIDWILDFAFNQNDRLVLLDSASGTIEIVNASVAFVTDTSQGDFTFGNSSRAKEMILEVRNNGTGAVEKIVLIDSYSAASATTWENYLSSLGYNGGITDLGTVTLGGSVSA